MLVSRRVTQIGAYAKQSRDESSLLRSRNTDTAKKDQRCRCMRTKMPFRTLIGSGFAVYTLCKCSTNEALVSSRDESWFGDARKGEHCQDPASFTNVVATPATNLVGML
jgi:hypothetical protein